MSPAILPRAGLTPAPDFSRALAAALTGCTPHTARAYRAHLERWRTWSAAGALDREEVLAYVRHLEAAGAGPVSRNQALAAIKRLAAEAAALNWIDAQTASTIAQIKAAKITGTMTGLWLTRAQLSRLLALPDRTTLSGRRDAALLALLAGCGLRRSEACALTVEHFVSLDDGTMLIRNLTGKGGRVRTIAVPRWAQRDIAAWIKDICGSD
jgi:site-specific recombinase XerD